MADQGHRTMIARVVFPRGDLTCHIMAAAAVFALFASIPARAQQVPTVDIAATRRAASIVTVSLLGSTDANELQVCMDGEKQARDTIIKNWSTYADSDRVGCLQPHVYLPGYVEWLTCIEMNKAVREARKASGAPIGSIETGATVTLPRVDWLRGH
jgi:hypothetical protein